MKQTRYLLLPLIAPGALLITATAWAKAGDSTRVGKTASVTFYHKTQVGSVMFQPGDYAVRHRVIGAEDFMVFQRMEVNPYGGENEEAGKPQRVECRMAPLARRSRIRRPSLNPKAASISSPKSRLPGRTSSISSEESEGRRRQTAARYLRETLDKPVQLAACRHTKSKRRLALQL